MIRRFRCHSGLLHIVGAGMHIKHSHLYGRDTDSCSESLDTHLD